MIPEEEDDAHLIKNLLADPTADSIIEHKVREFLSIANAACRELCYCA